MHNVAQVVVEPGVQEDHHATRSTMIGNRMVSMPPGELLAEFIRGSNGAMSLLNGDSVADVQQLREVGDRLDDLARVTADAWDEPPSIPFAHLDRCGEQTMSWRWARCRHV
jgi:hypothetical protein